MKLGGREAAGESLEESSEDNSIMGTGEVTLHWVAADRRAKRQCGRVKTSKDILDRDG